MDPFRVNWSVPFLGQTTQGLSSFSPRRDCSCALKWCNFALKGSMLWRSPVLSVVPSVLSPETGVQPQKESLGCVSFLFNAIFRCLPSVVYVDHDNVHRIFQFPVC